MEGRTDVGLGYRDNMNTGRRIDGARVLQPRNPCVSPGLSSGMSLFTHDNGVFPEGTLFRGYHKGSYHYGRINNGALVLGSGMPFYSFSAAARTITRRDVDGGLFWEFMRPGESEWSSLFGVIGKDSDGKK